MPGTNQPAELDAGWTNGRCVGYRDTMPRRPSSVADRYDGIMLGFFLAGAAAPATAARFPYLRARINDYLSSISVAVELPADPNWLVEKHHEALKIVWHDVAAQSAELGDF